MFLSFFRFISFFSLQNYNRYFTPMQEKPYPFGGKFLKTSFFILLLPQIQKNTVSLWQKKHASDLSIYGALTLSLPLTFGKKRKCSFLSLNRGISSIGRAIGSQSIGWEFESPMLHKSFFKEYFHSKALSRSAVSYP